DEPWSRRDADDTGRTAAKPDPVADVEPPAAREAAFDDRFAVSAQVASGRQGVPARRAATDSVDDRVRKIHAGRNAHAGLLVAIRGGANVHEHAHARHDAVQWL